MLRPSDDPNDTIAAPARLMDREEDVQEYRNLIIATRSLAAFAEALDVHCPTLGAVGGSSPSRLRGGAVPVRSYRDVDRPGWFDRVDGCGTIAPLSGTAPFVAVSGERGLSIDGADAQIVICINREGVLRLRLLLQGEPGAVWSVRAGDDAATVNLDEHGTAITSLAGGPDPGPIRVWFKRLGDRSTAPLRIVGLSAVGQPVPATPDWAETRFELVPVEAWPVMELQGNSDWQRGAGFLPPEPAVPQEGLYAPFCWSTGNRCVIQLRVMTGGMRSLRLALSASVRDQRVRLVVEGRVYDWSDPLAGPIGHIEHRACLVDWPVGDIDVILELSDVLRAPGQELGIILFAVALAPATKSARPAMQAQSQGSVRSQTR